jgi:hypothetical protein
MNFRTILLATTILLLSQKGFSQEKITQEIYTRYYAVGNYKMVDWYQDEFQKQISYDFGYRISGYGIFVNLSYQHYHGISTPESLATVTAKRQFDLYANTYAFGMGFYINQEDKLSFAPFVNINIGNAFRLQSTSVYNDGFASYGSENGYNGTYMDSGSMGLEAGLLIKFKVLEKLAIECEPTYMWLNHVTPANLDDKSLFKTFANSGIGGGEADSGITNKVVAPKLMIGLSYQF